MSPFCKSTTMRWRKCKATGTIPPPKSTNSTTPRMVLELPTRHRWIQIRNAYLSSSFLFFSSSATFCYYAYTLNASTTKDRLFPLSISPSTFLKSSQTGSNNLFTKRQSTASSFCLCRAWRKSNRRRVSACSETGAALTLYKRKDMNNTTRKKIVRYSLTETY